MRWGGRGCVRGEIIQDTKTWKNGNTSGKRQRKRGKKRKRNKDSALDSRCHSVSYKFKDSASLTHGKVHIGTFSNQWWWGRERCGGEMLRGGRFECEVIMELLWICNIMQPYTNDLCVLGRGYFRENYSSNRSGGAGYVSMWISIW